MSRARVLTCVAAAATVLSGCIGAPPPARLDSVSLGRNAAGEGCVAARGWSDPAAADAFARSYSITCANAAASRPLGNIRVVDRAPQALAAVEAQFECAEPRDASIDGQAASARRCLDRVTGLESVRVDMPRGNKLYVGSATPALLAQVEEGLAVISGLRQPSLDVTRTPTSAVVLAELPARAAQPVEVAAAGPAIVAPTSIGAALAQGISFNHRGMHVEASRVLNDALTRITADMTPPLRAELLVEAALADSNLRFPEAAQGHFAAAAELFSTVPTSRTPFIIRKRDTYLALDALNRGAFAEALTLLDQSVAAPAGTDRPLQDPAVLLAANQPKSNDGTGALALADAGQLARLVLNAQAQYARSVALLGKGDVPGAVAANDAAAAVYRPLTNERIDQAQLFWLGARIARQRGRLDARNGKYDDALKSFDTALDLLRRSSIANAGTGAEPAIAEAALERAAIFARTKANAKAVRETFGDAVNALVESGATSAGGSIGMEDYLDLLVREANRGVQPDTYERFARAVQANGSPAAARQITELRNVVTADPAVGGIVRERADLERELTRLNFAIAGKLAGAEATSSDELIRARSAAETRLLAVDAQLAADPRYRTLDERPATLAEIRQGLRPGEAYVKLTTLTRRIYGLVVTADRTFIYQVANSEPARAAVMTLATQLRSSIDGDLAAGKLVPYDEARAYTLFRLIAGPASGAIANARAIVVDPSGPLQQLPIGVLLTSYDADRPRTNPFDFSNAAFLASRAAISTALSPRSFLVARALPASRAPRSFLGLGQNQPPPVTDASRLVQVGFGCSVPASQLSTVARSLKPISALELKVAADALGARDPQFITGAAFTDTAVSARGDLDRFEVLHFATHGLQEGVWGCPKSPPALVTSFGPAGSDGLLDFTDVAKLRLDANLVVLSACDTAAGIQTEALLRGSGQERGGDTLEGLVRAFLAANARSVLATYWQVSADRDSVELMRSFYGSARSATIGEALRRAQTAAIANPQYSHPFYWGAFFLVGDSAKPMLTAGAGQVAALRR